MHTKLKFVLILAGLLLFGFGQTAQADLALIGPINPVTGFPGFVQDANNFQLGPCDRVESVVEDPGPPEVLANAWPCVGTEVEPPEGPFVDGNILEFSYYRTEANFAPTADIKNFRLRIEVQGGVLPPASINNAVRLVLTFNPGAPQGVYTIFHPFGQQSVVVGANEIATKLDMELDGGVLGIFPALDAARAGNVSCFWDNESGRTVIPDTDPFGGGTFLGQADALGAPVEAPLVPIIGNAACPQGPSDGIANGGDLEFGVLIPGDTTYHFTNLFTVEGKLPAQVGFLVDRATYERNADDTITRFDLWISSVSNQLIEVSGGTAQLINASGTRTMIEDEAHLGHYYMRMRLANPIPPHPISLLVNGLEVVLVDEVKITRASHNVSNNTVDIRVVSSDQFATPPITITDEYGNVVPPAGPVPPNAPLRRVTATSDLGGSPGGSDTQDVDVLGSNVFF